MADEPTFLAWGNPLASSSAAAPPPGERAPRNGPSRRTVLWAFVLLVVAGAAAAFALGAFRSGTPAADAATPAVTSGANLARAGAGPVRSLSALAPSPAAFHARMDVLCAATIRQDQAIGTPDRADLAKWSRRAVATMTAVVKGYAAVVPSANEAHYFRLYLAGLESSLSQLRLIAAAAKAGNLTSLDTLAQETTPAEAAGTVAANAGGFTCEPAPTRAAIDASAEELAHSAQVAMETYATDNHGSYAGASPKILNSYEATIQIRPGNGNAWLSAAAALAGGTGYTLTATATDGDTFSIVRSAKGSLSRSCTTPTEVATGSACSAAHTW